MDYTYNKELYTLRQILEIDPYYKVVYNDELVLEKLTTEENPFINKYSITNIDGTSTIFNNVDLAIYEFIKEKNNLEERRQNNENYI